MTEQDLTPAEVSAALKEIHDEMGIGFHVTACVGTWNDMANMIVSGSSGVPSASAPTWREALAKLRENLVGAKEGIVAAARSSMAGAILAALAAGKPAVERDDVIALGFEEEIVERDLEAAMALVKQAVAQAQSQGLA